MQNFQKPFSDRDIEIVKVNWKRIADKHGCNNSYVSLIAKGERKANSDLAKLIIKDIEALLKTLRPIERTPKK